VATKSQGNAIEFTGYKNTLEIQSGMTSENAMSSTKSPAGASSRLAARRMYRHSICPQSVRSAAARFQGFFACEKRGTSTWVVSGAPSGLERYIVAEGILRLTGSGNLTVERVIVGSSGTLDISGVTTIATTLPNLYTDESSQILLGNKALTLPNGGNLEGTITGKGGITLSAPSGFDLLSTCKISAGPVAVRGSTVLSYGATIIGNISVADDGGVFSLIEASVIVGDVTIDTNGSLQAVTQALQQPGIIRGNLDFRGGADTVLNYKFFPTASDLWMLEVTEK
jgi:hypothetical protein